MHLTIKTKSKDEVVDITDDLEKVLNEEDMEEGQCSIFVKHTTCFLTTLVVDPGTDKDFINYLRQISPNLDYAHRHDPSHTTDHLIASLGGPSLTIPINNGKLDLGTWQRVVLVELNGPKDREITVRFID